VHTFLFTALDLLFILVYQPGCADRRPGHRVIEVKLRAAKSALLLEHEKTLRQQKRFESRARAAKLRHAAYVEDVDYRAIRGLDRALFLKLAVGDWIRARHNLLVTGPCGVGKSWLACALGNKACRDNFSVAYHRVPRLFAALALGRADGRYTKMLSAIARLDLLILDDWGPEPLDADQRRDLLEIVEAASCPSIAGTKLSENRSLRVRHSS
jgi:DNA replication protein DnaC